MTEPTVLFVADGGRNGDATAAALDVADLEVIVAEGLLDARKRVDEERVECVVLSVPLDDPVADQLVRILGEARPSVPVLLVGDDRTDVPHALAAAATDHLPSQDVGLIAERIRELVVDRRVERALERHRVLEDRVLAVATALPDAGERPAVERLVYDKLSAGDCYRSVWVGEYDAGEGTVRMTLPIAAEFDAETLGGSVPGGDDDVVARAVATGNVQTSCADGVEATSASRTESADVSSGRTATIVVPFVHDGVTLGVALLETDRPKGADGAERSLLDDLGGIVGRELARGRTRESALAGDEEHLERFAQGLAHELKNPLGVVMANIGFARDGDEASLDRAEGAVDELDRIVDGMLSLARGAESREERDLRDDVDDAWAAVEAENAELVVDGSTTIEADHDQVVRLLSNLFRNAVEHSSALDRAPTPSDDAVDHGTTGDPPESDGAETAPDAEVTVRVGTVESGFYVEDDGPGVPPDERERIFEWGYSTNGAGLGLGIVAAIADAHGWSIEVSESHDGGARFEVTGVRRPSD